MTVLSAQKGTSARTLALRTTLSSLAQWELSVLTPSRSSHQHFAQPALTSPTRLSMTPAFALSAPLETIVERVPTTRLLVMQVTSAQLALRSSMRANLALTAQPCPKNRLLVPRATTAQATEPISTPSARTAPTVAKRHASPRTALLVTSAPVAPTTSISTRVVSLVEKASTPTPARTLARIATLATCASLLPRNPTLVILRPRVATFALLDHIVR